MATARIDPTGQGRGEGGPAQAIDAETAALLSGLGQSQTSLGQIQEGMANLARAFDYYEAAGEVDRAVELAAHPVVALAGRLPGRGQMVARALALAPPDSLAAGRLLSEQVRPLALEEGDYPGAIAASERALAIAQQHGDRALEARTLAVTASVHGYHRHNSETKEAGLRAIALAQAIGDPWPEALAAYWTCAAHLDTGDTEEARRLAALALPAAERARDAWLRNLSFTANQRVSGLQGEWQAARDFSDRALSLGLAGPGPRVQWEYQTGNFAQGEAFLEQVLALATAPRATLADMGGAGQALAQVAYFTGDASRLGQAESLARSALAHPIASRVQGARSTLALIAAMRGDAAAAEEQYPSVQSERGGILGLSNIPADRLLGSLCVTMGRLDQAVAHFEEALAFCRRAGFRPELAWTCHDFAVALLQRAAHGEPVEPRARPSTSSGRADWEKAMALLDEALALSRELGMRPLMERVLSRREILGA